MDLVTAVLVTCIALGIFAVALSTFAIIRTFFPPQSRDVMQLRNDVEEVAEDNGRIHARLNERAARENLTKARAGKVSARELAAEAAEIVKQPAAAPLVQDVEAERARFRRMLSNH